MDNIITITEERQVNISQIEREIAELEAMAEEIEFLNVPEYLPDYAEELVLRENEARELIKADIEDRIKTKQEELNSYNG